MRFFLVSEERMKINYTQHKAISLFEGKQKAQVTSDTNQLTTESEQTNTASQCKLT